MSLAAQAGDQDAVQAALEPALAAISAGAHKLTQQAADSASWVARVRQDAPFLLRYCAVWVYTAMCTPAVSLLEKQRQYQQATELLQQLLGGQQILQNLGSWVLREAFLQRMPMPLSKRCAAHIDDEHCWFLLLLGAETLPAPRCIMHMREGGHFVTCSACACRGGLLRGEAGGVVGAPLPGHRASGPP